MFRSFVRKADTSRSRSPIGIWVAICLLLSSLSAAAQRTSLFLDVVINGSPLNMICAFTLFPGGVLGTTRRELLSMGLRADAVDASGTMVMLQDIPTLHYSYQASLQRISITVSDRYLQVHSFDLRQGAATATLPLAAGRGMVLNYDLFGNFLEEKGATPAGLASLSATLEGRIFSELGTFSQSGIVNAGHVSEPGLIRLDTSFRASNPSTLISWDVGDTVSGGLWWTRPIRLGGLQAQTNFMLRPDLVTMALPNLGGTAAVPSTVDVYINNVRSFSQDIAPGPFNLTNIPVVTGAGNAEIVVRDAAGHETSTNIPFYGSASVLAQGLSSWSVEAGQPRLSYGSVDDHYSPDSVFSGTWRHGVLPSFTAELHAEAGSSVANGGAGGALRIGSTGVLSLAAAASARGGKAGGQANAAFEANIRGISLDLQSQHSIGDYEDLASATAEREDAALAPGSGASLISTPLILTHQTLAQLRLQDRLDLAIFAAARVPPALDRITLGGRLPFDQAASWGLSFVHEHDAGNIVSKLVSVSYARPLFANMSASASFTKDLGSGGSTSLLIGLTIPLGPSASVAANLSGGDGSPAATLAASQSLGPEPGSVGWQVEDIEGAEQYRQAALSYRSSVATLQASVDQARSAIGATLEASGAVAGMAGDVFLSNRINDAFAVVDAGAPGIAVSLENRPVGETDSQGMLLVPGLRSYQRNQISIDPSNLPVDAEIETTRQIVRPADRAGTLVSMKHHTIRMAALVTFVRADGSFIPAGSWGKNSAGENFIIGYDGQSFINGLVAENRVAITVRGNTCHAAFPFKPQPGQQVKIGPITCR
jgi:outer membrane usher protein